MANVFETYKQFIYSIFFSMKVNLEKKNRWQAIIDVPKNNFFGAHWMLQTACINSSYCKVFQVQKFSLLFSKLKKLNYLIVSEFCALLKDEQPKRVWILCLVRISFQVTLVLSRKKYTLPYCDYHPQIEQDKRNIHFY